MKKFCIFCGSEKIEAKNLEHIIPDWLIKLTGDPEREVGLGLDVKNLKIRKYSFNQFKFPSCVICNEKFSKLENNTKEIILKLLKEEPLAESDFKILLEWFDKIRIGLWLGYYQLDGNLMGITPNFAITNRINQKDRMLLIYKEEGNFSGLNFFGANMPLFQLAPLCFGLRIKNFCFINISGEFLFSERLGIPYIKITNTEISKEGLKLKPSDFQKGSQKIKIPLLNYNYSKLCTEIYQPIIYENLLLYKNFRRKYENRYIKNFIDISQSHCGNILINKSDKIINYSKLPTRDWIPIQIIERDKRQKFCSRIVLGIQNYLASTFYRYRFPDKKTRQEQKHLIRNGIKFNKKISKDLKKEKIL